MWPSYSVVDNHIYIYIYIKKENSPTGHGTVMYIQLSIYIYTVYIYTVYC